jgi:excisionase family DNA binding protein
MQHHLTRISEMVMPANISSHDQRLALRINDAAVAIGLSRSTLYKLMATKQLRTIKVAGRRLVPMDALHDLVSKQSKRFAAL